MTSAHSTALAVHSLLLRWAVPPGSPYVAQRSVGWFLTDVRRLCYFLTLLCKQLRAF